jgi:hypothetical protein
MSKANERVRKAILEVVDNQLRDRNPPARKRRLIVWSAKAFHKMKRGA